VRRELVVGPRGRDAPPAIVNGAAGVVVTSGDRLIGVAGITVAGDRIVEIDLVTDPAKLRGLEP
jgi:RNA polymerase sigma-70 factor (ECF subfamily)